MHRMVQEQNAKRPKQVAVRADVGHIEPKDDVMVCIECPRCFQESRRVHCEVTTDERVINVGAHDLPAKLKDELTQEDDGRCQRAGKLRQAELDGKAKVAAGKDEIQKYDRCHVNVEYGLVVEEERAKRVHHKQRARL